MYFLAARNSDSTASSVFLFSRMSTIDARAFFELLGNGLTAVRSLDEVNDTEVCLFGKQGSLQAVVEACDEI